jgi:hypothetical protein
LSIQRNIQARKPASFTLVPAHTRLFETNPSLGTQYLLSAGSRVDRVKMTTGDISSGNHLDSTCSGAVEPCFI